MAFLFCPWCSPVEFDVQPPRPGFGRRITHRRSISHGHTVRRYWICEHCQRHWVTEESFVTPFPQGRSRQHDPTYAYDPPNASYSTRPHATGYDGRPTKPGPLRKASDVGESPARQSATQARRTRDRRRLADDCPNQDHATLTPDRSEPEHDGGESPESGDRDDEHDSDPQTPVMPHGPAPRPPATAPEAAPPPAPPDDEPDALPDLDSLTPAQRRRLRPAQRRALARRRRQA